MTLSLHNHKNESIDFEEEWSFASVLHAPAKLSSAKGRTCTLQVVDSCRPNDDFCVSGTELPHSVPDK